MADSKKYNGSTWEHSLRKLTTATDTFTTLPVDVYADGNNATVGISGNTVQNGTPTPDNPIMPQSCGERTVNLLDKSAFTGVGATIEQIKDGIRITTLSNGYAAVIVLDVLPNTDYSLSYIWEYISGSGANTVRVFAGTGSSTQIAIFAYSNGGTFNTGNNTKINIWFYAAFSAAATVEYTKIMLNTGNTALPYEPYGQYKIPISSANTTTPVYLGEVETTRQIRKLVLTGEENWEIAGDYSGSNTYFRIGNFVIAQEGNVVCTHYASPDTNISVNNTVQGVRIQSSIVLTRVLIVRPPEFAVWSLDDFKAYLTAQYAAGTPVTVWYVLGSETTGIVNEPLMKIGDYADTVSGITIPTITGKDTFDVETTLKPSEASLSYTGWYDATVEEWDGSQWNE